MTNTLKLLIIFLFSLYNLYLYLSGNIDNYISERFFTFSLIGSLAGLIISGIGIIYELIFKKKYKELKSITPVLSISLVVFVGVFINPIFLLISIPLFIVSKKDIKFKPDMGITIIAVIVLGFGIPPASLSSITASQRVGDLNSVTLEGRLSTISRFSNTANYEIADWIASINYNPDLQSYIGKEVNISGFVFDLENYPENIFLAARFVVTCCAVDARPVGLNVRWDNWQNDYNIDQWVEVKGKFEVEVINNNEQLIIVAETITKIDEPERPYIY